MGSSAAGEGQLDTVGRAGHATATGMGILRAPAPLPHCHSEQRDGRAHRGWGASRLRAVEKVSPRP